MIASAVREWIPEWAQRNYIRSLETFDWRWRFKTLAEALDNRSSKLDAELSGLAAVFYGDCSPNSRAHLFTLCVTSITPAIPCAPHAHGGTARQSSGFL